MFVFRPSANTRALLSLSQDSPPTGIRVKKSYTGPPSTSTMTTMTRSRCSCSETVRSGFLDHNEQGSGLTVTSLNIMETKFIDDICISWNAECRIEISDSDERPSKMKRVLLVPTKRHGLDKALARDY